MARGMRRGLLTAIPHDSTWASLRFSESDHSSDVHGIHARRVNGGAISGDATFCFYNTLCGLFDLAVVKLPRGLHAPKFFDSVA